MTSKRQKWIGRNRDTLIPSNSISQRLFSRPTQTADTFERMGSPKNLQQSTSEQQRNSKVEQIHTWCAMCAKDHGACCNDRHSTALSEQLHDLLLVDVIAGCIIKLPSTTRFIALSYVWGMVPTLKCTSDTISTLSTPNALYDPHIEKILPETIRNAMSLVKQLGEQYLWVDCLCVMQDSSADDMSTMLQAMARIYTSAEFTIVAACGDDANHGLQGFSTAAAHKAPSNDTNEIERETAFPWESTWASRAWTFQESLFSRRLLIFGESLSWICGRCEWIEGHTIQPPATSFLPLTNTQPKTPHWPDERPHLGVPMGLMSLIPRVPSFGRWGMIVENYSRRQLRYDTDSTRALSGATQVMTSTFPGGIHHGLPLFFLDIALLWQPQTSLSRRPEQPSWSWTGWKGIVSCLLAWYPHFPGVFRSLGSSQDWVPIAPLKPIARWELPLAESITLSGKETANALVNAFYNHLAMRFDPLLPLPSGWQRHTHRKGDFFTTTLTSPNTTINHAAFKFCFPLPSTPHSPLPPLSPSTNQLLTCTTQTFTLHFGRYLTSSPTPSFLSNPDAEIATDEGIRLISLTTPHTYPSSPTTTTTTDIIGVMVVSPQFHTLAPQFEDPDKGMPEPGDACELILLSEFTVENVRWARAYTLFFEFLEGRGVDGGGGFYNVMWVERRKRDISEDEEDVVYRRGVGVVAKGDWDVLGAGMRRVRLGEEVE
ncbi:HET-domain-containing protein [Periconia macrospinosa]|uniref:HET-domain-containing protein n=1 Tax=Periconia macrospinosa TaxID=97972 RepID=A0A2V1DCU9_9PLEO|nr:HET-domain-containing protein [Periconia macrospinosa]